MLAVRERRFRDDHSIGIVPSFILLSKLSTKKKKHEDVSTQQMQLPNFHNSSHKSEHYYRYLETKQNVIETQQMKNQQL